MIKYAARRFGLVIPVLIGVTLASFFLMRLAPGDTIMAMIGASGRASTTDIPRIRAELGLDKPLPVQYFDWIGGLVRGDLGESLYTRRSVLQQIREAIPVSLELGVLALAVSLVVAIPFGILSATRQDSPIDYAVRLFSISALSVPDFLIGVSLLLILTLYVGYLPPQGYVSLFDDPVKNLQQVMFPALILGLRLSAVTMRMTRSTMLDILRQDYIRTARSKGLHDRVVIYRHALKNALVPVVTIVGNQFAYLLGGTVIMETLFALPGMGRLTLDAIVQRDYTQVQGDVAVIALLMVSINVLVDLSYAWFDPRIRYH